MKILHVGLCANGYPYNGLQNRLSERFIYKEISASDPDVNKKMLKAAREFYPDLVFMQVQTSATVDAETVRQIQAMQIPVFNWTGDVRDPIPDWYRKVGKYCVTLFSNYTDVYQFRKEGFEADYLQIGYDCSIFRPHGPSWKAEPIVFLGNNYPGHFPLSGYRYDMVKRLKAEFGDRFGVYGGGWNGMESGNLNGDQISEAALYRGCKVAINVSHFSYERYFSDRMLRIVGSGAYCVSHEYLGIEKDWSGLIRTFKDFDELVEICSEILQQSDEQLRMKTESAADFCFTSYEYRAMVDNLIRIYNEYKA